MKQPSLLLAMVLSLSACTDMLDIKNPNQPTPSNASNKQGLIALAKGALYMNGLNQTKYGTNYFWIVNTYHDAMGDEVLVEIANYSLNSIAAPNQILLDNGGLLSRPSSAPVPATQIGFLKYLNQVQTQDNPFAYEWAQMYAMNNAMNNVITMAENLRQAGTLSIGEKNTLQAWSHFWKGFAYSRIGSLYIAGIINNTPNAVNNKYVSYVEILAEAETNFSKVESLLSALTDDRSYREIMNQLIPDICRPGKGKPVSTDEWKRHINTLRARNILVNTPVASMTSFQWDQIITLSSNGILETDNTFTVRTDALGNLLNTYGYVASQAIGSSKSGGGNNKISERLIQDFKPGDLRLANNFDMISTYIGDATRGTSFNTRYVIADGGNGVPGAVIMVNSTTGADELYIAGSFEENLLMLAEANINKGNIDAGLSKIDQLRNHQGAGLPLVAGTGLNSAQAKEELRRERRVGLAFRGFSFYDARRWGVLQNGRTGSVVVDFNGLVSTNATINYGFLDYWDVPIAESYYNPPSSDSAPIVNPK
jgi:hypothetical protein